VPEGSSKKTWFQACPLDWIDHERNNTSVSQSLVVHYRVLDDDVDWHDHHGKNVPRSSPDAAAAHPGTAKRAGEALVAWKDALSSMMAYANLLLPCALSSR
jgi:hypothetical protein